MGKQKGFRTIEYESRFLGRIDALSSCFGVVEHFGRGGGCLFTISLGVYSLRKIEPYPFVNVWVELFFFGK